MCKFLTKLFKRKKRKDAENINKAVYSLVYEYNKTTFDENWKVITAGTANWRKNAGLDPVLIDDNIICLFATMVNDNPRVAAIRSKNYYDDGAFECSARFFGGKGSWPAIWITSKYDGDITKYYEVDLSEYYETRNETTSSYHCYDSMHINKRSSYITAACPINPDEWNKFRCEWNKDNIRVYINDKLVFAINNTGDSNIFPVDDANRKFDIILSMQYGTNKHLQECDTTELPLCMEIKDIKVYKLINPAT